jgi:hypothetical protein
MEKQKDRQRQGFFRALWQGWKRVAKKIGNFQARVLLAVFYFTVFCPFALAVRWSSDPLGIKTKRLHGWLPLHSSDEPPLERARRQF